VRFEANLIHPDDAPLQADGELELPDDLVQLGDRLRDEAKHLADRFPAGSFGESIRPFAAEPAAAANQQVELANNRTPREPAATHTDSRGRKLIAGTLASVLVVAIVGSAVVWRLSSPAQPTDAVLATDHGASRIVSDKPAATLPATELTRSDSELPLDPTTFDVPAATNQHPPALYILEASGPELEGLLDLWEQDSPQRTKISI
jgi:hypothetical protein